MTRVENRISFCDSRLTENTRVAYPLDYIPGAVVPSIAKHPNVIIFLTADAFGVMPPIAKLTKEGAMYHFISGYTSKLAGTERGITEPKETFSQCFGAPFMPLHPIVYARMLGERISTHKTMVYLINTGWTSGPYGIGKRMELKYTRKMVSAAINGESDTVSYKHDDIFNLDIPVYCLDVPRQYRLDPSATWSDKRDYVVAAKRLAGLFVRNFERFGDTVADLAKIRTNRIRKGSPEQIPNCCLQVFSFSVEIQSLKSIALTGDWPLDSAPARSARFDRANH